MFLGFRGFDLFVCGLCVVEQIILGILEQTMITSRILAAGSEWRV